MKLVWATLLLTLSVSSQTNRGGIAGTVTDPTQSVVPAATVTITNLGTNEIRKTATAQNGTYTIANLEPVGYKVEVEAPGFRKTVVNDVKVDTASVATVDVAMQTGTVETQVTVAAEVTTLNTQSGTTSSVVTQREIQDAPLVNRSVLDLALTLPNVSGDAGSENPALVSVTTCPGCNLSVGGGRPLSTLIMADGTNNTGVSLARTMVSFSPETVQEFTVQTSVYSAEYGTTGGGIINVTTKSGTNDFNGTALWYNRNPEFAAAPFTLAAANRPTPTVKYNQFSLAAGGPIYIPKIYNGKNRTFWFAAYEPFYRRDRLDQYGLLPTEGMRQGDFSGVVNTASGWLPQSVVDQYRSVAPNAVSSLDSAVYSQYSLNGSQFSPVPLAAGQSYSPFPNNVIPKSMLDATALKSLKYIAPAGPYYLNANGLISNIYAPRLLRQDEKRYTVRIDQAIGNANRINGRFTSTPIIKTQNTPVSPTGNSAEYSRAKQIMIADTHTVTPTLLNDLRLNYTRGRFSLTTAPEYDAATGANLNTELGLPNITKGGVPALNGLFPGTSLGGGGTTAGGLGGGGSTQQEDREERYAITDIVYKTRGAMSFKFGVDLSHSLQNVIPLFAALGGTYAFSNIQTNSTGTSTGSGGSPFASYLLGVANGNVTLRNTEIPYYYRWNAGAAFVQDDWRVKPNLTLNIGLRYSLEMPRTEKYNNQGVYLLDQVQTVSLPSPLTLSDGEVINCVKIPPFAFSGRGGNSKYLTPPDYMGLEPRFGFAWSPAFLDAHHVTIRGGYGLSHAPVTGSFRLPQPDFGATNNFATTVPSTTANPNYVMRLGENPPVLTALTPAQAISAPANGVVTLNSLNYFGIGGFAISPNYHTPYVQNWNLTASWQVGPGTTLELSYVGAKGTHLFLPHENVNPKNRSLLKTQLAANLSPTATVPDPLGRVNPATGNVLTVQNGSLGSPFLGFSTLYVLYDAASDSMRHAGYISVVHRTTRGLTFTGNYTWAKSIDDASSSGGDKNVLTPVGGQTDGQVAFGATRANDRSVSTFDQRHVINATFLYDLPFGRGRRFMTHAWKPIEFFGGGWTLTGNFKEASGFPYQPYLSDTNLLGDVTHTARPDLVAGVPLINPLYSSNCPTGAGCQPYINPSAFMRPALGEYGSAPRTLDGARGPWLQTFNFSIQKNFSLGESGKRRIQFRMDALNAFNHPMFLTFPNNAGGADFMGAPSTATLSAADYNTWATANGRPLAATPAGTDLLNQINSMVNTQRNALAVLPSDFFRIQLPENFYGKLATGYDITTLQGYKYFRLRNAYATNFGTLYSSQGQPRYIQFGVKVYF